MRILVTGSRDISERDVEDVSRLLTLFVGHDFVVGDCPSGVDRLVRLYYPECEVHRAEWDKHDRAAGPIRNQGMVDSGADLCLAFPTKTSRGTRDCMRRARAAGIPVLVMELEGA